MAQVVHRVVNERSGDVVGTHVEVARGPWQSFRGLMFKPGLPDGHGMLFRPAQGIHTQFMRFPIDLIFLDRSGRVCKIRESMKPWRFDFSRAAAVIEMSGGQARAAGIDVGDTLRLDPIAS